MITKTLIATATAALIAAGSLTAMTSTASAKSWGYGHGYGYGAPAIHLGAYGGYVGHKVCHNVFKRVFWQDYYGYQHVKKVFVGKRCDYQPIIELY
jgi:hypothetical protein